MSEEEKKEKRKPKVISYIALIAGIATLLCRLLMYPFFALLRIFPEGLGRVDTLELLAEVTSFLHPLFWPIAIIGLILSIVTLFIERNKCFRLLPFIFVLAGILLYYSEDYIIDLIIF